MNEKQSAHLKNLYSQYNDVIKPLIALYEAREEQFPTPLFNEIRAFNDHIARCYLSDINESFIDNQLRSAERHIVRIILDCYKYLNISFNTEIEKFERKTKNIDLTIIDNGEFYIKYKKLRSETINSIRTAKSLESKVKSQDEIFKAYEIAFNKYSELDELISINFTSINWAKAKSWLKKYSWIFATVISAIISLILTLIFTCEYIQNFLESLFSS